MATTAVHQAHDRRTAGALRLAGGAKRLYSVCITCPRGQSLYANFFTPFACAVIWLLIVQLDLQLGEGGLGCYRETSATSAQGKRPEA